MSVRVLRATIECDACGDTFKVDIDPAEKAPNGIMDVVVESIKDDFLTSSVEHDLHLCETCTKIVGDIVDKSGNEDYQPTREEILEAVGAIG